LQSVRKTPTTIELGSGYRRLIILKMWLKVWLLKSNSNSKSKSIGLATAHWQSRAEPRRTHPIDRESEDELRPSGTVWQIEIPTW